MRPASEPTADVTLAGGKPFSSVRIAQALAMLAGAVVAEEVWRALVSSRGSAGFEWVNHDVGNVLYLGQRMLDGERLYADFAEANPPGIFFVAEAVQAIAKWTSLSPIRLFHGVVLALGLFGVYVIQRTYARLNRPIELLLSVCASLLVLSGGSSPGDSALASSFGQREQLFALAFGPYMLWRLSGQKPSAATDALTWLVGFLSSLKPHFAILFIALEVICRLGPRRLDAPLRRVVLIAGAGALLPYALLLVHSPHSLSALWTETVPLHTRGIYAYFNQPFAIFLRSTAHGWVLAYALAIGYFVWSGARPSRRYFRAAWVLPPLAYALVVQQHKFWEYHAIVLLSLLAVMSYGVAASLVRRVSPERATPLFGLLLAAAVVQTGFGVAELRAITRAWKDGLGVDARLLKIAPLLAGRHRVLYYSTSIAHMRLALLLHQRVVGRWNHELLYPALVRGTAPERRERALARYCDEQKRLIAAEKPDAIVFHASGQGLESRAQELLPLLVDRCHVLAENEYSRHSFPDVEEATVFLRSR